MSKTAEKARESGVYKHQYNESFVDKWDDLINWDFKHT